VKTVIILAIDVLVQVLKQINVKHVQHLEIN